MMEVLQLDKDYTDKGRGMYLNQKCIKMADGGLCAGLKCIKCDINLRMKNIRGLSMIEEVNVVDYKTLAREEEQLGAKS